MRVSNKYTEKERKWDFWKLSFFYLVFCLKNNVKNSGKSSDKVRLNAQALPVSVDIKKVQSKVTKGRKILNIFSQIWKSFYTQIFWLRFNLFYSFFLIIFIFSHLKKYCSKFANFFKKSLIGNFLRWEMSRFQFHFWDFKILYRNSITIFLRNV